MTDPLQRRSRWLMTLAKLSGSLGSFDDSTARMVAELRKETESPRELIDHLRLCGAIPEHYRHDSSEEKLYSKYTDALVSEALTAIGLSSVLLSARADSADVQAHAPLYSLVGDAKAFRLTRTAKNQKDFKVQAMDTWRGGLDYALIVCPIYQLPVRVSQIYHQAITRNVCILSYSHLATLVALAACRTTDHSSHGLHTLLQSVATMHPSKSAVDYWTVINRSLIGTLGRDRDLWLGETRASVDSLELAKQESIVHLNKERDRLLGLSHREALEELVRLNRVDDRIARVYRIRHGHLLEQR